MKLFLENVRRRWADWRVRRHIRREGGATDVRTALKEQGLP